MKKTLLSLAVMLGLGASFTSCSDENQAAPGNDGNVTFNVAVPGSVLSRADFGDGTTAQNNVAYYVYDQSDAATPVLTGTVPMSNLKGTLTLSLANSHTYDVVFLATAATSPYTYDATMRQMSVEYSDVATSDENLDAFYAVVADLKVSGPAAQDVKLYRPFAQLNIGTSDKAEYEASTGTTLSTTSVSVTGVYSAFDLMAGDVTGPTTDVTFKAAALPEGQTFPVSVDGKTFTYLSMDYLLVNQAKDIVEVALDVTNSAGTVEHKEYSNIPVQRNYRTNIYGALLTDEQMFNVEIVPGFGDPDYDMSIEWNGEIAPVPSPNADGIIEIVTPAQLAGLAKEVGDGNTYLGKTVKLTNDMSLSNLPWSPIGTATVNGEGGFCGTFDGQGHTISNLSCKTTGANAPAGLFGNSTGLIKNVNLKNVDVQSDHYAAGIVAYVYVNSYRQHPDNIEGIGVVNCTVDGGRIVCLAKDGDNGDKVGGVVGGVWQSDVVIAGNTASNLTVEGYRHVGGVVGWMDGSAAGGAKPYTVENNTASNVIVVQNLADNYKNIAPGELVGGVIGATNKVTGIKNSVANNVSFEFKNYTADATVNISNGTLKAQTITFDNMNVQSIALNGNFAVVIKNSTITPASVNPGGTYRFGLFWATTDIYDLTVSDTKFNGSWSHAIYVQGNAVSAESTDNVINITGCDFADWGKKETAEEDIKTSAAFKTIRTGNFAAEDACVAWSDQFIANNTFSTATLATGRIHVALGAGNVDTYIK